MNTDPRRPVQNKATPKTSANPAGRVPQKAAAKPSGKAPQRPAVKAAPKAAPAVHKKRRKTRRQMRSRRIVIIAAAVTVVLLVLAVVLLSGDNNFLSPAPTATPTIEPTATPAPTAVPTPTAEPTATPVPTAVPAPTVPAEFLLETSGGVQLTGDTADGRMPYRIYVSKDSYTIAILALDDNGEYTRLLHTWRTAIGSGNKTRAGSYKIDQQWLWYEWADGGYTPFTSHLEGTKMRLHSPLHNKNEDWNSLWREGYRQIGTKETQGCLRTTTAGAAWVYFNCPVGTEVLIANDALYQSEEPPALGDSKSDPTRPLSPYDVEIPAAYFTVAEENVVMTAGETRDLNVTVVTPAYEGPTFSFVYKSGSESVVTVSDGKLTAVAPGSTQVLVMADDINRAYRIVNVTVN